LVKEATTGANALLGSTGIGTSGPSQFAYFAELEITAAGVGTTNLDITPGNKSISEVGNSQVIGDSITFRGATVTVTSAVPEPGSLLALTVLGGGLALVRRRK